jgi:uncharacterized membrane protein YoaK (UPF0700 family)
MMTGNVTQLVIDMVDLMAGDKAVLSSQRIGKQLWPITGFALGALGGAFGYAHLGFCALALPIVAVTLLACDATKLAPQTA